MFFGGNLTSYQCLKMLFVYTLADTLWVSSVLPFDVQRENKEPSPHLSDINFFQTEPE